MDSESQSRKRKIYDVEDLTHIEFETSEGVEVINNFEKMGLRNDLLRGIYSYGKFKKMKTKSNIFRVWKAVGYSAKSY